ncbi:MAG: protein phosphatase 2C domain-containing protein [Tannerellaceae bacterium]|jgi:protein phosphatase|nr:protein phosphatase 2C domain-containing protein [Tannerellaceae bacterium]
MKSIVYDALGFTAQGKRKNNEDCIRDGKLNDKSFFIVCDGVGGEAKGEVASRLACDTFDCFFRENEREPVGNGYFSQAIQVIEQRFDTQRISHPDTAGMATTIALLVLDQSKAWSAHAGDSRIYQIRKQEIVFKTHDHSYINKLLDIGSITPDEARELRMKRILTQAIQGKEIKPADVSVTLLDDIREGDHLFLCTDGVTESITDEELLRLINSGDTLRQKTERIQQICFENSSDNYSGYLIQIKSINNERK